MVVHRASLLRELIAHLPEESLHPNKQLAAINPSESGVEITFQDGSVYHFDAVIGADGIFSTVREHVLHGIGADEEHSPSPAGFWDCRNVVLFDEAKAILGEKYFDVDRQYDWVGDGAFIMHDVLEDRTMVQCVISGVEKDASKNRDRKRQLTQESLKSSLSSWLDGPIADGMINVCTYIRPLRAAFSTSRLLFYETEALTLYS